jgi:hypothetical protein
MGNASRRLAAASILLASALAAQESGDRAVDAATRDAARYFECLARDDRDCIVAMTDAAIHQAAAAAGASPFFDLLSRRPLSFEEVALAPAWEPFLGGGRLFSFVPYFMVQSQPPDGSLGQTTGFLVGVSDDAGENWSFVDIFNLAGKSAQVIDGFIPGYATQPRPVIVTATGPDQALRERWRSELSKPPEANPVAASTQQAVETVIRDSERYAACMTQLDEPCIMALIDVEGMRTGGLLRLIAMRSINLARLRAQTGAPQSYDFDVARPWEPFAAAGRLYSFVPIFESDGAVGPIMVINGEAAVPPRIDRIAYLIAASDDGGQSWRFFPINATNSSDLDLLIPGYGDGPRPEVLDFEVRETDLERSRSLLTLERRFALVGDAISYVLKAEIREPFDGAVDLSVTYDDPADPDQPAVDLATIEPGQTTLAWQSPPHTGFETGETYAVEIEGRDAASGEKLFTHRQDLRFYVTPEIWKAALE